MAGGMPMVAPTPGLEGSAGGMTEAVPMMRRCHRRLEASSDRDRCMRISAGIGGGLRWAHPKPAIRGLIGWTGVMSAQARGARCLDRPKSKRGFVIGVTSSGTTPIWAHRGGTVKMVGSFGRLPAASKSEYAAKDSIRASMKATIGSAGLGAVTKTKEPHSVTIRAAQISAVSSTPSSSESYWSVMLFSHVGRMSAGS